MTDLRDRFNNLDSLRAPDLWREVERRAAAAAPATRGLPLAWAVLLALLLTATAVGAALIGSGVLRLPAVVDASATPTASADPAASNSPSASASPTEGAGAWTPVGQLSTGRSGHSATVLPDGTVVVAGGLQVTGGGPGINPLWGASVDISTNSQPAWRAVERMLSARAYHTSTLLADDRLLVVGGVGLADITDSVELYDPADDMWTATASLSQPRAYHTATLLPDGRVLVAGGMEPLAEGGELLASAEVFDPSTRTWATTSPMIDAHAFHTATLLADGRVLLVGGRGADDGFRAAEIFDPSSGSWSAAAPPPGPLEGHTATALRDGLVLVVGGYDSGYVGGSGSLLYDPVADTWTRVPDLLEGRAEHSATLLLDGRVLVVGGLNGPGETCGRVLRSAELFDPASRTWSAAASMEEARYRHVAILLADGSVVVIGGTRNICQNDALDSVERYDPGGG